MHKKRSNPFLSGLCYQCLEWLITFVKRLNPEVMIIEDPFPSTLSDSNNRLKLVLLAPQTCEKKTGAKHNENPVFV